MPSRSKSYAFTVQEGYASGGTAGPVRRPRSTELGTGAAAGTFANISALPHRSGSRVVLTSPSTCSTLRSSPAGGDGSWSRLETRRTAKGAVPDHRLRDLLRRGLPRPLAVEPTPSPVEGLHDRRQLRLLRLVGLALRVPAGRRDGDRAGGRPRGRARAGSQATAPSPRRHGDRPSGPPRLVQVLRVSQPQLRQRAARDRAGTAASAHAGRAPDRHLLLHVYGDQLRRGRVTRRAADGLVAGRRRLSLVLPASRGGARRARARAAPPGPQAPRPAPDRLRARGVPDLRRPVQEGGHLELPRLGDRGSGLRDTRAARLARDPGRDLRLRGAD